jgi:hypothetical protein
MMMRRRRRRRKSSRVKQQIGRRSWRVTVRDRSRGVPPVPLATPLLLTDRVEPISTLTTMTTVVLGQSQMAAGLVVARMSTGMMSRRTRSEFVDSFFFFFAFWCLLPKEEKIGGVNKLFRCHVFAGLRPISKLMIGG